MSSRDSNKQKGSSSRSFVSTSSQSKASKSRPANQPATKQHASRAGPGAGCQNKSSSSNPPASSSSSARRKAIEESASKPAAGNGSQQAKPAAKSGANLDCNVVVLKPTSSRALISRKKSTRTDRLLVDLDTDHHQPLDSNEMATTLNPAANKKGEQEVDFVVEEETDVDGNHEEEEEECSILSTNSSTSTVKTSPKRASSSKKSVTKGPLPAGWEQHMDKSGPYFWHVSTGIIQRNRPSSELSPSKDSILAYHDDDEINVNGSKRPSVDTSGERNILEEFDEEDEFYDLSSTGAALTIADDTTLAEETAFVVYPLGCCEFDETQLVSSTSTKAIQKCILKLSNRPVASEDEIVCWGLTQSQPVFLKLVENHIQFTDIESKTLLRSQPIPTIKTWAVDDDNNFAFVVEDRPDQVSPSGLESTNELDYLDSVDYALLSEPTLICYVFHSMDETDDMSCRVASRLTEEINRYKEQLSNRISKSTRLQQMRVEQQPLKRSLGHRRASTDVDDDDDLDDFNNDSENETGNNNNDDDDELEANNELTMNVKYIGKTPVPRPNGIEVLNVAIDKCLAEASRAQINRCLERVQDEDCGLEESTASGLEEPLTEAKLHVSPSSVIVENTSTGEIIVECRIRFLTFMGISRRDIRWCGFIMQNPTNKSFVAHCFECHPTAGHVCEAIQLSCSRMYEKIVKNSQSAHHRQPETISIIPSGSLIRNTLAKTFSRIKLNPLVSNTL